MSYYSKVLQPGESVKFIGKLHWVMFGHAILYVVLAVVLLMYGAGMPANSRVFAHAGAGVLAVLGLVAYVRAWFVRVTTEIVVTDKRIIHKVGWISRRTEEINITKVETVDVGQGVMGRVLGYGTVLIRGVGGSWEPIRRVADPLALRNAIIVG